MNNEFLNFINKLMEASPETVEEYMTDDIKEYLEILKNERNNGNRSKDFGIFPES